MTNGEKGNMKQGVIYRRKNDWTDDWEEYFTVKDFDNIGDVADFLADNSIGYSYGWIERDGRLYFSE